MAFKPRHPGEKYRPVATVLKVKDGVPLTMEVGGVRYRQDNEAENKQYIQWRESIAKRDLLVKLLGKKGVRPPKPHTMKLKELEELLLGAADHDNV